MSYRNMLRMRCNVIDLIEGQDDGIPYQSWSVIEENIRCFLDLGFIRAGKDPIWTADTKNAQNRSGVLFLAPNTSALPGQRIEMVKGPKGTFTIDSSLDEAWDLNKLHHYECFVSEVDRTLSGYDG